MRREALDGAPTVDSPGEGQITVTFPEAGTFTYQFTVNGGLRCETVDTVTVTVLETDCGSFFWDGQ